MWIKVFLLLLAASIIPGWAGNAKLSFEENKGQTDPRVQYLARGKGYTLFLTSTEAVLRAGPDVLRIKLAGANPASKALGAEPQVARSNYFIGDDPAEWRTDVANYGRVRFAEVYPGIDLVYYGKDRQIEHDWMVKPGADPSKIRLKFAGVRRMYVDQSGDLVLETRSGQLRQKKPVAYQGNGKEIAGRYVIRAGFEAGFELGRYDFAKPLVIDPVLVYSSYLGGSLTDLGFAIAADAAGSAYVTGATNSIDFPVASALQGKNDHVYPSLAFVTKISPDGSTLLYSTYLGGGAEGHAIAVDSAGNAYIAGASVGGGFPVVNGYQHFCPSKSSTYPSSAFVTKLNPAGNAVLFSTCLSGGSNDSASGIAVDAGGNVYVTGSTNSPDFPTTNAIQNTLAKNKNNVVGYSDAFVAKLSSDGSTLLYSTYLGGSFDDGGAGIAVDASGNAYVVGTTFSTDFPTLKALQPSSLACQICVGGPYTAFVAKISPNGSLIFSTYLGGSSQDAGTAIALDSSGNAYLTGLTKSPDFPTVNPMQGKLGTGYGNAFVTKINASGTAVLYSTFLGGSGLGDRGSGIAVNTAGEAWIGGNTVSSDFPIVDPLMSTGLAGGAATTTFVSQLSEDGSKLLFSTYVGPSAAGGIALDGGGSTYLTGATVALNFPTVKPFQGALSGTSGLPDAFALKISRIPAPTRFMVSAPASAVAGAAFNFTVTAVGSSNATIPGYSGVVHFSSADGAATLPANATLANGTGTFTATLRTAGNESITATDTVTPSINGISGTIAVAAVGPPNTAPMTLSHIGNFVQGQPTALYTIAINNGGSVAGSGTVSVVDTLPVGLTATAIGGPGWTCTLGTISCSRSDSLPAGASYPSVTVTVSVASNTPSPAINKVILSGGLGTANATDTTAIQPAFADVSTTDLFLPAIDLFWETGITSGCGTAPPQYCSTRNITLAEMAVFVVRSVMGNDNFTYTTTPYFTDVPSTHLFFKWIQKMQDLGIALQTARSRGRLPHCLLAKRHAEDF